MKARVAQLAEHRPCKSVVVGSTPAAGSTFTDPTQTHSVRGVFARTRGTVICVTERMEHIANRAVRPVVVWRKVA